MPIRGAYYALIAVIQGQDLGLIGCCCGEKQTVILQSKFTHEIHPMTAFRIPAVDSPDNSPIISSNDNSTITGALQLKQQMANKVMHLL